MDPKVRYCHPKMTQADDAVAMTTKIRLGMKLEKIQRTGSVHQREGLVEPIDFLEGNVSFVDHKHWTPHHSMLLQGPVNSRNGP